jgi:hypothetical protein
MLKIASVAGYLLIGYSAASAGDRLRNDVDARIELLAISKSLRASNRFTLRRLKLQRMIREYWHLRLRQSYQRWDLLRFRTS